MANQWMDAIRGGKIAALRAIVKADSKMARHAGAVVEAARCAFLPGLEFLHKQGADLNATWKNYRPLHALIQPKTHGHEPAGAGRLASLDWLLANGADPRLAAGWPSARAVLLAAFAGEPAYVKRLKPSVKRDPFLAAAMGDRKAAADPHARDAGGLTPLHCASASRMDAAAVAEVARALLDAGADVRARFTSWDHELDAVYLAAGARNQAIFELLLERGADPTEALTHAAWGPGIEFCEVALKHGAVPDRAVADGKPLLNHLIAWGQVTPALWLLARGAAPNLPDSRGWTAVHQAASRGNARLMNAVLEAGGDPQRRDHEGRTPRDVARKK